MIYIDFSMNLYFLFYYFMTFAQDHYRKKLGITFKYWEANIVFF